jgi:chromosome segregation ATPase
MRAAFYLVDEIDVCMDAGNSTVALDILMEQSRLLPDTQFISITHMSIDHVPKDERYIDVIK